MGDAHRIMRDFKIGGIPVVNDAGKLIGILTNRDLRFQKNMSRLVTEIMTKDGLITANEGISLEDAESILQEVNFILKDKGIIIDSYFDNDQEDYDFKLELNLR